jgi:L-asparaginase II
MLRCMIDDIATNDVPVYKWLRDVMAQLGNDGMSSDESDVDDRGMPFYRVKLLPVVKKYRKGTGYR